MELISMALTGPESGLRGRRLDGSDWQQRGGRRCHATKHDRDNVGSCRENQRGQKRLQKSYEWPYGKAVERSHTITEKTIRW